jgi:hypothetical protein
MKDTVQRFQPCCPNAGFLFAILEFGKPCNALPQECDSVGAQLFDLTKSLLPAYSILTNRFYFGFFMLEILKSSCGNPWFAASGQQMAWHTRCWFNCWESGANLIAAKKLLGNPHWFFGGHMENSSAISWKWVLFEYQGTAGAEVFVAGEFNKWSPTPLERLRDRDGNGRYSLLCMLQQGEHHYLFKVNGEWMCDPGCPNRVRGEDGRLICVLSVGHTKQEPSLIAAWNSLVDDRRPPVFTFEFPLFRGYWTERGPSEKDFRFPWAGTSGAVVGLTKK